MIAIHKVLSNSFGRVMVSICTLAQPGPAGAVLAGEPILEDFWQGQAVFELETDPHSVFDECPPQQSLLGDAFHMDFLSSTWLRDELWVFYIRTTAANQLTTGLARSQDGICFTDAGEVVSVGSSHTWDDAMASFPGIYKDSATWYLVYEGNGTNSPGDIGLAESMDGVSWTKADTNPILVHLDEGWERKNIGTPSLLKNRDTWFLFYHGFDGSSDRIGVATGTDLRHLVRYTENPILGTGSSNEWDSHTVGKRSIIKEGIYYYMVFEGATSPFCEATSKWSSGIARSLDLFHWEKWPGNPVLPRTTMSCGYDGPEWIQTPDGILNIYFRTGPNLTRRARLRRDCDGNSIADQNELDLNIIYVSAANTGCENGSSAFPLRTISEASRIVNQGGVIHAFAGHYPEPLSISSSMRIESDAGLVVIGR